MAMITVWSVVSCMVVSLFSLSGCAANKPFVKRDAAFVSSLKCIRYETPGIQRKTRAETLLLTAGIAAPGGLALQYVGDEYAKMRGEKMRDVIPDFASLVIDKFSDKLNSQPPILPPLSVLSQPVKDNYVEACTLIEFKVKKLAYGYLGVTEGNGFVSDTLVTMKDANGEVLWRKGFLYRSKDYERDRELEQFEADGAKLLREEVVFAADMTADDFYQDLNGSNSNKSGQ